MAASLCVASILLDAPLRNFSRGNGKSVTRASGHYSLKGFETSAFNARCCGTEPHASKNARLNRNPSMRRP
jgi:hypothetical protein